MRVLHEQAEEPQGLGAEARTWPAARTEAAEGARGSTAEAAEGVRGSIAEAAKGVRGSTAEVVD